ncbi:hypothetical protein Tco_0326637 [Tanacetum coccineum]
MASADNTSGLAPQRKKRCTLQCTLSLEEEKSSYLQVVLSTTSISSHARSVNKWINDRVKLVSATPYVPPSKKDYEIRFQPLFDEYFNPPPRVVSLDPVAIAAQELLIQSVQLRQLPLIKMYLIASTSTTNQEIQFSQVIFSSEKQAGYVQTNLTLTSAEPEMQSMVDVPIHQEDLVVQRTLLIDHVISMVTEKTASTPTPPTTQAHARMCSTSCWKDISRGV